MKIKKTVKTLSLPALFFFALIVVWELGIKFFGVPIYFIPAPSDIYFSFVQNAPEFVPHLIVTLEEIVLGFLIAVVIGTLAGILVSYVPPLKEFIYSLAIFTKTVPIIALSPIIFIWFGYGLGAKAVVAFIISFFPIFIATATGLLTAEPDSINLMKSLNATKIQFFLKLQFPNSLPYYFSGLKIGVAAANIGAIVGEFVAPTKGLGYMALISLQYIKIPLVFLSVFLMAIFAFGFFGLISLIEKFLVPWKEEETK